MSEGSGALEGNTYLISNTTAIGIWNRENYEEVDEYEDLCSIGQPKDGRSVPVCC